MLIPGAILNIKYPNSILWNYRIYYYWYIKDSMVMCTNIPILINNIALIYPYPYQVNIAK